MKSNNLLSMWLPTPVYERIPQLWFLMGLGFWAFGLYLGFDFQLIWVYLALGTGCIARSIWTLFMRRSHRAATSNGAIDDTEHSEPADDSR